MANILDCDILASEFELKLRYYVQFWTNTLGKGMNPFILPSYGLNSATTVLLKEWLWYLITHESWYAFK